MTTRMPFAFAISVIDRTLSSTSASVPGDSRLAMSFEPPAMITAGSEASVPQLSVIVRKAYGAGLYAMDGPGFIPDAFIALPTAKIAIMGPQAAINAVYYNQLQAISDADERAARTEGEAAVLRQELERLRQDQRALTARIDGRRWRFDFLRK